MKNIFVLIFYFASFEDQHSGRFEIIQKDDMPCFFEATITYSAKLSELKKFHRGPCRLKFIQVLKFKVFS